MQVQSISTFRDSLHDLCRRPKHKYTSCPSDICDELGGKAVEQLLSTNNAVLMDDGNKCLVKIRLPCTSRGVGKSGGFRLIAFGNRQEQKLVLLEIFPKVGPKGQSNISDGEIAKLLKTLTGERDSEKLVLHYLDNKLKLVPATAEEV